MKGAHCPVCKERGPDLTIEPQQLPPAGTKAELMLMFECGECGRALIWSVTHRRDGSITYTFRPDARETVQ